MNESRRQRFKRLATKRVNNTLNQLRILGNLANKSYYDYNEEDVFKMIRALQSQLSSLKGKFHINNKRFKL
jgi:hypothetical protein